MDKFGQAALFSGQGSQFVGMGRALCEFSSELEDCFVRARSLLGFDLQELCWNGPLEKLTAPEVCQPALYVVGYGAFCALRSAGLLENLRVCGGFSLGEWTALAAAGAVNFEEGLRMVSLRAKYMREAGEAADGTMAALLGGERGALEELCRLCGVTAANYNAPGQIVISGERDRVADALSRAATFGVRKSVPLAVAGAYHSSLMAPAAERLAKDLAAIAIGKPTVPLLSNVTGEAVEDPEIIGHLLCRQIKEPVRWESCLQTAWDLGAEEFIECGAGNVLVNLTGKNLPKARARTAEDVLRSVSRARG
ncbi:MAG: ACP S-malonyltransferase [Puniceicoccales bacterium]|nr:ACP S-malonyltransferase [Puniceicoccales bacterium]